MADQVVIDLARELYDRFVMGGWEPQDAYGQIEQMLDGRLCCKKCHIALCLCACHEPLEAERPAPEAPPGCTCPCHNEAQCCEQCCDGGSR